MSTRVICANCNTIDRGHFCSNCGERLRPKPAWFLWQLLSEFLPNYVGQADTVLKTWVRLVFRPTSVLRDAMLGKYWTIGRPALFLAAAYSLFGVIGVHWGTSYTRATWYEAAIAMPEEDSHALAQLFGIEEVSRTSLNETDYMESVLVGSSDASAKIRDRASSILASDVADFVESETANAALGERLRAFEADKRKQIEQIGVAYFVVFPVVFYCYAKGLHFALGSKARRTRRFRETLVVAAYIAGFAVPIFAVIDVVAWSRFQTGAAELIGKAAVLPLLVFRALRAFEFTHFVSLSRAVFANLVAIGFAWFVKGLLLVAITAGMAISATL
jgi:hypothetical protein